MSGDCNDFDWNHGRNDDVVIRPQQAVAVYENMHGDIVIRSERGWDEEKDSIIVVTKGNAQYLIDGILRVLASKERHDG